MEQSPKSDDRERPGISRRTVLKAGIAGGAVLLLARFMVRSVPQTEPLETRGSALDPAAWALVEAIAPVLLEGSLPIDGSAEARAEVVAGVDRAVAGLAPASRKEITELFALLSFAPTRCLLAGVWSPWPDASRESVAAFLDSWRDSRFALLRSGYGAMHQLVMAAWYGNVRAWPAIGYAGPPVLKAG
jgi:hypothetical protein